MQDRKNLKLGWILYKVVTGSITLPYNSEFYGKGGYLAFLNRQDYFATNTDYSMQYRKSFDAVNRALARLSQYNRLPYFYEKLKVYKEDGEYIADVSEVPYAQIANVFRKTGDGDWENYGFTIQGEKLILETDYFPLGEKEEAEGGEEKAFGRVEIEYKKAIPIFEADDLAVADVDSDGESFDYSDVSPNMAEYGLSPTDVNFVIYYAQADVLKELDPVTAGNQLQIAENYYSDLTEYRPTYNPRKVRRYSYGAF